MNRSGTTDREAQGRAVARRWRTTLIQHVRSYVRLGTAVLALVIGSGWLAGIHPVFDLANHFQVQYVAAAAVGFIALLALRSWRWSVVALLCMVVTAARLMPWWMPETASSAARAATAEEASIRLLLANVLRRNTRHEEIIALIDREQPDIVALLEVDARWMDALRPLHDRYPHVVASPQRGDFGIAVFSRIEPKRSRVVWIGEAGVPSIECGLDLGGREVAFLATHPVPPVSLRMIRLRDEQLARVADRIGRIDGPRVLAGDLNATMWSGPYRQLVEVTGLRNARRGYGVLPTWPMNRPFFMHIPIDHVLVSEGLEVVDLRLGSDVGSDHLPIIVDLAMTEP